MMFEIRAAARIPDSVQVRAGYSANAEIVLAAHRDVLTIAESALEITGDSAFVQLLTDTATQTFVRHPVVTGMSDGINIEIESGLEEGDSVRGNKKQD